MTLDTTKAYGGDEGTDVRNFLRLHGQHLRTSINHEEFSYNGEHWICHWESKSDKFRVPVSGWVCYVLFRCNAVAI